MFRESLGIDENSIVQEDLYNEDREPDARAGGEYWGNQHAEVDEIYKDTVRS